MCTCASKHLLDWQSKCTCVTYRRCCFDTTIPSVCRCVLCVQVYAGLNQQTGELMAVKVMQLINKNSHKEGEQRRRAGRAGPGLGAEAGRIGAPGQGTSGSAPWP